MFNWSLAVWTRLSSLSSLVLSSMRLLQIRDICEMPFRGIWDSCCTADTFWNISCHLQLENLRLGNLGSLRFLLWDSCCIADTFWNISLPFAIGKSGNFVNVCLLEYSSHLIILMQHLKIKIKQTWIRIYETTWILNLKQARWALPMGYLSCRCDANVPVFHNRAMSIIFGQKQKQIFCNRLKFTTNWRQIVEEIYPFIFSWYRIHSSQCRIKFSNETRKISISGDNDGFQCCNHHSWNWFCQIIKIKYFLFFEIANNRLRFNISACCCLLVQWCNVSSVSSKSNEICNAGTPVKGTDKSELKIVNPHMALARITSSSTSLSQKWNEMLKEKSLKNFTLELFRASGHQLEPRSHWWWWWWWCRRRL